MPARKQKPKPRPKSSEFKDPFSMRAKLADYLEWMEVRNYSEKTVTNRFHYVGVFLDWCDERSLARPNEITKPILERFQRHLYFYRKKGGKPLSFKSQHNHLTSVREFFKWLTRNNFILYNPASELELPRLGQRLPKYVLSVSETEQVLSKAEIDNPLGLRDRAILEVLYSTGMRRRELINLAIYDLDFDRGTVFIREGKGKKDRTIPIGERALAWCEKYLNEVRPSLVFEPDDRIIFLTQAGEKFGGDRLSQLVKNYIVSADIGKKGSCHLFRHTMATLLLENGADIRHIQAMLGHSSVTSTQIYTQVSIRQLKQIHTATHPARLERKKE